MDYDTLTVLELKTICKDRGLRVSGNKSEIVIRLMEDDESKLPKPVEINSGTVTHNQPQVIFVTQHNSTLPAILGVFIILYGMFRAGYSILWIDYSSIHAVIGMGIGLGFVFAGIIVVQGYKVGLKIAVGILLLSGALSLFFIDEMTPLSIGLGTGDDACGLFSVMLSTFCLLIVGTPLFFDTENYFKEGRPNYLGAIADMTDGLSPLPIFTGSSMVTKNKTEVKVVTNCTHCDTKLKVPEGYSGKAKCPSCNQSFKVNL